MSTPRPVLAQRTFLGHPPGLVVLFLTEMWERFSFYTMGAMFTLYLQDREEGFGWTEANATDLYSTYIMFVYASPLIGGWLADRKLGYRRAVLIGGVFFMAGHLLLAFRDLKAVYAALACLVIGNGLFKPNVSTMVGNLYPEGSPLKDRAYNIFYMGINVGALLAPLVAEVVKGQFGFHPAFVVAAFGMVVSVSILWWFRHLVEPDPDNTPIRALVIDNAPAHLIDEVPDWKRVGALIVVFLVVIVYWMGAYQGGSTITYWAQNNTAWRFSGIISNAINPAWVIVLTFPLIWFWRWLARWGLEPSTPAKIALGMLVTALGFLVFTVAALHGEAGATGGDPHAFRVSPLWLIGAYGVLTIGELMLSPMGLSLVSRVAPARLRGLMMGGWFVATAAGGKLSVIGVYWGEWLHSSFFALLAGMTLGVGLLLLLLLRPLKTAMPGV
jgi:POT family proton-dependent oligopeptide transporter